jgi:uncharacterized protein
MTNPFLSQIWVYPVKSMVGGRVQQCSLNELGIVGDRVWAVRDVENGGIRGAKKLGGLMKLSATFIAGSDDVSISLPSGRVVRSDDRDVHAAISGTSAAGDRPRSLPTWSTK